MVSFTRPKKTYWLLNQVPFDGCLLVFNANQPDWRSKACDFVRNTGMDVKFHIHCIQQGSRRTAHVPSIPVDLYVTLEIKGEGK